MIINAASARLVRFLCVTVEKILLPVHCVDIQEFYDTTLLDDSKSVQQKTTETLQIVAKWEQTLTIAGGLPQQTTLQTEVYPTS